MHSLPIGSLFGLMNRHSRHSDKWSSKQIFHCIVPHPALRICCWENKEHLEQNFRLHAQKFEPSDSLICDLRQPKVSTVTLETLGLEILLQESCKTSPQHGASSGTRRRKKNTVGHSLKSSSLTWTPTCNFCPLSRSSMTTDMFLQMVIASAWR